MKIDIEKIKAEYEQKVQEAIEANKILDILGDDSFRIYVYDGVNNEKRIVFRAENICSNLSIEKVGLVLSKLPVTRKIDVYTGDSKRIPMDYQLTTSRGYKDSFATLNIEYIHNNYEIRIGLPIELN